MKNHHKIKLIAASVALMASFGASAGLGGLNVQSRLGEPFSGSITVTGDEAKALLEGGKASVSNGNLRASVRKSGDKTVLNIRSARPIQDPVLIFQVGVGSQSREYTAIIDPAGYDGRTDGATRRANSQPVREEAALAEHREAKVKRTADSSVVARQEAAGRKNTKAVSKPKNQMQNQNGADLAYGRRHLVRQGETLTGIASRIRPQNMTLAQTVQALVNANPEVFVANDADKMLAGKVLDIPPRARLQQLAAQPSPVPRPSEHASDIDGTKKAQDSALEPNAASAPGAAASQAVVVPADKAAPASDAVSAPDKASESATLQASEVPASTAPAATDSKTAASAEEGGLWRWLLLGGAALIAAYLLSKLLRGNKKEQVNEPEEVFADPVIEDIDEIEEEPLADSVFNDKKGSMGKTAALGTAAAAATVAQKAVADDELEVEDDFGDDIFFTDTADAPVANRGDVNLDLNTLDKTQSGILSGAVTRDEETEKRREVDWDTVESTESVYEPDPESPYDSSEASAQYRPAEEQKADYFAGAPYEDKPLSAEAVRSSEEKETEDSWDFFSEEVSVAEPGKAETEASFPNAETAADNVAQEKEPLEFTLPREETEQSAKPLEVAPETDVFSIQQGDALAFQDSPDLAADAAPMGEIGATETIEWADITVDDIADNRRDAGFISEAVGMTAPLEAKYELAKMYAEIGDPEAARETLQQLLEESDGAILAKAKAMLRDLDA